MLFVDKPKYIYKHHYLHITACNVPRTIVVTKAA